MVGKRGNQQFGLVGISDTHMGSVGFANKGQSGMRSLRVGILVAAAIVLAESGTVAQESEPSEPEGQPTFLFVQSGRSLDVDRDTITLVDARDKTIEVADRPDRLVRRISNETFASLWNEGEDSFAVDPPNAIISVAGHEPVVVILTDVAIGPNSITYDYELLDGRFPYRRGPTTIVIDIF